MGIRSVLLSSLLVAGSAFAKDPSMYAFPFKTSVTAPASYEAASNGQDYVLTGTINGNVVIVSTSDVCRVMLNGVAMTGSLVVTGDVVVAATAGTKNSITCTGGSAVSATGQLLLGGPGRVTFSGGGEKTAVLAASKFYVYGGENTVNMTYTTGKNGYGVYVSKAFGMYSGGLSIVSSCTAYKDIGVAPKKSSTVELEGGRLSVTMPGLKSVGFGDATVDVALSGTAVTFTMTGDGAKGFKTDGAFNMTGGLVNAYLSGAALVEAYLDSSNNYYTVTTTKTALLSSGTYLVQDTAYPYAVKAATVNISGGHCRVNCTGVAGRGIAGDTVAISGGTFDITVAGATTDEYIGFLNETNRTTQLDRGTAVCLRAGGASQTMTLTGGTFYLSATGNGGKCISGAGTLVVGTEGASTLPTDSDFSPNIQAMTFGEHVYVAAQKPANYGSLGTAVSVGTNAPSASGVSSSQIVTGSGENVDYTNPKGVKFDGDITFQSGRLRMYSKNDGGEGLESKDTFTMNGGMLEGTTYDDCINASTNIIINGGYLYCGATNNDGIDSNGKFIVNGGIVLAFTAAMPEVGIDANAASDVIFNGGIIVAFGSATDMAYGSSGTQASYRGTSVSASTYAGKYLVIKGTKTITVRVPAMSSTSGSLSLVASAPGYSSITTTTTAPTTGDTGFHGVYQN